MFDEESPAFNYFTVKRSQCCPERIIAQHANRDSVAIAGPIDILDEVIQVGGFDFVLSRRETLCRSLMRDLKANVSDAQQSASPKNFTGAENPRQYYLSIRVSHRFSERVG